MADFLTRLAERSQGESPAVQPLIAPRFTPTAHPPEQVDEAPAWSEVQEEIRTPGSRSAPRSSNLAHQDETVTSPEDRGTVFPYAKEPSSETPDFRSAPPHRGADAAPAIAADYPDVPEIESKPGPSSRSTTAADPVPTTPANRRSPESVVPERGSPFDAQPRPRPAAEPAPVEFEAPASPASHLASPHTQTGVASPAKGVSGRAAPDSAERLVEREVGPGRAPEPLARTQTVGPEVGTASVVPGPPGPVRDTPQPADTGVRSERGLLEGPPASREEPPPIRVNIGRIEVRAVTPPPAPPRRDPSPAKLSLDDYLRQRSGGRR
jgi:hypothetical protein